MASKNYQIRKRLWETVDEDSLWVPSQNIGFCQVPRGLTLVNLIIDKLSKGKPVSQTFLGLWVKHFDHAVVRIDNPTVFAFEAGFGGARALGTWRTRMRILKDLGMIDFAPGPYGEISYVLMFDPYKRVVQMQKENLLKELEAEYNTLVERIETTTIQRSQRIKSESTLAELPS